MPIKLRKRKSNAVTRRFKNLRSANRKVGRYPSNHTETKLIETSAVSTFGSVGTGGSVATIAQNITQGTDNINRIGRKVVLTGFRLCGTLIGAQINSGADDPYNTFRITCYTVKQGISGIAIAVNDELDGYHKPGLGTVYYDKKILLTVPAKDSVGYIPAVRNVDIRIRFRKPIVYSAVSNIAENEVFLQCVSDSAVIPHCGFVNGTVTRYFEDA